MYRRSVQANIQKLGDGLFLKICRELAEKDFKGIKLESMIVDNASMQLVSRPQQFNGGILLSGNLYGKLLLKEVDGCLLTRQSYPFSTKLKYRPF